MEGAARGRLRERGLLFSGRLSCVSPVHARSLHSLYTLFLPLLCARAPPCLPFPLPLSTWLACAVPFFFHAVFVVFFLFVWSYTDCPLLLLFGLFTVTPCCNSVTESAASVSRLCGWLWCRGALSCSSPPSHCGVAVVSCRSSSSSSPPSSPSAACCLPLCAAALLSVALEHYPLHPFLAWFLVLLCSSLLLVQASAS